MKELLITALTLIGMLIGYLCYDSLIGYTLPGQTDDDAAASVEE